MLTTLMHCVAGKSMVLYQKVPMPVDKPVWHRDRDYDVLVIPGAQHPHQNCLGHYVIASYYLVGLGTPREMSTGVLLRPLEVACMVLMADRYEN